VRYLRFRCWLLPPLRVHCRATASGTRSSSAFRMRCT